MWKNIVSWVIAIIVAVLAFSLIMQAISFGIRLVWDLAVLLIQAVAVLVIAVPVFMIVRKKFIK